ncbi:unnamed protein product, partial [marine sediment metagenome]
MATSKKRIKVKRTYGILSQYAILRLLRTEKLLVDTRNGTTYRKQLDGSLIESITYPDHSGRRCIRIQHNGRRRNITRARLVYLAKTNLPIPLGMDVDHIDGNNTNDDSVNLRLLPHAENRGRN